MLSFACRRRSKERLQCPRELCGTLRMSLTPTWKITQLRRKYVFQVISVGLVLIFLQVKLDNALEEIVAKLASKYPLGLYDRHPDLPCFHHCTSNLHFNLDCL